MSEGSAPSTFSLAAKLYQRVRNAARPCVLCGAVADRAGMCAGCRADLPRTRGPQLPWLSDVLTPFRYAYPLAELVQGFKFYRDLAALHACCTLLKGEVSGYFQGCEVVLAVPLTAARFRRRGFNQAYALAQAAVTGTGLEVSANGLHRRGRGTPQSRLDQAARRTNVAGAFSVSAAVSGRRVVIVDDVVTTGATLSEIARCLRRAGARDVRAIALAYRD